MTRRRDMLLDEMGLAPRWRLRGAVPAPVPVHETAHEEHAKGPEKGSDPVFADVFSAEVREKGPGPFSGSDSLSAQGQVAEAPVDLPRPAAGRIAAVMQMDWSTLAATVSGCTACGLSKTRNCTVFGVGDRQARWLLVGEGPGAEEDARGEPFVGQSGRLLDNMLAALDMERGKDVFIANIVKCRPPDNRVPAAAEVEACEPYLHRQIELLQPKVIIALGKTAAVTLLGKEQSIASMRGKVFRYRETPLIVTYHPAYLLRSLPEKAKAWEDLCFARARVREWSDGQALASRDSVPMSPPE